MKCAATPSRRCLATLLMAGCSTHAMNSTRSGDSTSSSGSDANATGGTFSTTAGSSGTSGGTSGGGDVGGGTLATGGQTATQRTDCGITANATISTAIPTVGVVEWSSTLSNIDNAHIDFGLDTSYGLSAPVDLKQPNYRTLLLGMKASRTYHYRVVAQSGNTPCTSPDRTLSTGALIDGLPTVTITTNSPQALAGGYLVTEVYTANYVLTNGVAFILDTDGDIVWWYQPNIGSLTRALMSYDGNYMWISFANVPPLAAKVIRVSMDGLDVQDFSNQFKKQNHDLVVLPDETVVFIAYGSNGCDDIMERSPSGSVRTIVNSGSAFGDSTSCHCNSIQYWKEDDTITVGDLDHNAYFRTTRDGQIKWVLGGGSYNTFSNSDWPFIGVHNFHILSNDRLLFFNNGDTGAPSKAVEVQMDTVALTAVPTWQYQANPSIANTIMGDVQRLDNGNTLITFSTQSRVHEVSADGSLLQELRWSPGTDVGYATKRMSLYGPPPK